MGIFYGIGVVILPEDTPKTEGDWKRCHTNELSEERSVDNKASGNMVRIAIIQRCLSRKILSLSFWEFRLLIYMYQ